MTHYDINHIPGISSDGLSSLVVDDVLYCSSDSTMSVRPACEWLLWLAVPN